MGTQKRWASAETEGHEGRACVLTCTTRALRVLLSDLRLQLGHNLPHLASTALACPPAGETAERFLLEVMCCLLVFFLLGLF